MQADRVAQTLRVETISSAAVLGPARSEQLARDASLYASYAWVRWCESSPDRTAAHLVLRGPDRRPLAVLPAFLWRGGGASPNAWYDPHRVFVAARNPHARRHEGWLPLLLLGSCAGYRSEILFDPQLARPGRASAAAALVAAARALAREAHATLAAMYVPSAAELLGATAALGAQVTPTSAQAVIPVDA